MQRNVTIRALPFQRAARGAALSGLLVLLVGGWLVLTTPFRGGPRWERPPFVKPALALELPANNDELAKLLEGAQIDARAVVRAGRWFMPVYTVFFVALAFVHALQTSSRLSRALAVATFLAALATVALNTLQHAFITGATHVPPDGTMPVILPFAALKWAGFFTVMLLAAPIFAQRFDWPFAIAAALTFFAALGLVGCAGLAWTVTARAAIAVAAVCVTVTMALGLLLLGTQPLRLLPATAAGED